MHDCSCDPQDCEHMDIANQCLAALRMTVLCAQGATSTLRAGQSYLTLHGTATKAAATRFCRHSQWKYDLLLFPLVSFCSAHRVQLLGVPHDMCCLWLSLSSLLHATDFVSVMRLVCSLQRSNSRFAGKNTGLIAVESDSWMSRASQMPLRLSKSRLDLSGVSAGATEINPHKLLTLWKLL